MLIGHLVMRAELVVRSIFASEISVKIGRVEMILLGEITVVAAERVLEDSLAASRRADRRTEVYDR